jgi:hypothetical protein
MGSGLSCPCCFFLLRVSLEIIASQGYYFRQEEILPRGFSEEKLIRKRSHRESLGGGRVSQEEVSQEEASQIKIMLRMKFHRKRLLRKRPLR